MLEAPLRDLLVSQIEVLEDGLAVLEIEQYIPAEIGTKSFIDILAKDERGRWVIIELKRSDAASRQAIHEIYKYVEAVKRHLGARDDEIRAIIVSTEWKELLVPFSYFVQDTSISVSGMRIFLEERKRIINSEAVVPLPSNSGRILAPWHEISLYKGPERLEEGIASFDEVCEGKGVADYIMVELKAPDGFHEYSVMATERSIHADRDDSSELFDDVLADTASMMDRMDHMIYFVPQVMSAEKYLEIIQTDEERYEEVLDFTADMEPDERLYWLHVNAFDTEPWPDRDHYEIGSPAKFKHTLLEDEGWAVSKIHRRGAFSRNILLADETILAEVGGFAGTSGQRLKRKIMLADRAEFTQLLEDINRALPTNAVWANMMRAQLEEAKNDFPQGTAEINVFGPSTGLLTLFLAVTEEEGINFVPSYSIGVYSDNDAKRLYFGEMVAANNEMGQPPETFNNVLSTYYDGDVGMLALTTTWSGYEANDLDLLEDIGLVYGTFKVDINGDETKFYRMRNNRWRCVDAITPYEEFERYLKSNERLLRILVSKLSPRIRGGICDGSRSDLVLKGFIDTATVARGEYFLDPPEECDVCSIPLTNEKFFSDGRVKGTSRWANMCADCTYYYGDGVGPGDGQLYRKENDGKWLLVGGWASEDEEDEELE